jgi:seryl-tRNA synthetase
MLDLNYIREHAEEVKKAIADLNTTASIDEILGLDIRRRELLQLTEGLRAQRNMVSKDIARIKDPAQRQPLVDEMRQVGDRIKELEGELKGVDERLTAALYEVPNLPAPGVPVGPDETHNVITRTVGEPRQFDFQPLPHWDLGPALGILDFERGVKISGTRFYVLKGLGARLQRALITWMLDLHVREHGYTEVYPPYMVAEKCLWGTGQLPKFGENLYRDVEDDLWWIPTAEVPVTNLHREEILEPGTLPLYYVAYTACFRREKMSAGRDVRGIKRGHQFDKVEMVKIVSPETSLQELDSLVANAEDVCRKLEIPHRVVQMCTGDLSFTAAAKYDVEMWAPGCQEWLEVSS